MDCRVLHGLRTLLSDDHMDRRADSESTVNPTLKLSPLPSSQEVWDWVSSPDGPCPQGDVIVRGLFLGGTLGVLL